jgi:hypothetical protein
MPWRPALLACLCLAARAATAEEAAPEAPGLTALGQLTRLDLVESSVFVRCDGRAAELELRIDRERTLLTWGGRLVRLEELKPGERVSARYAMDAAGLRRASVLKLGAARHALVVPLATSP